MSPKREHLCFFTLFQFATYRSDTASSIAFASLYTFSYRRSVPYGNTSAFVTLFQLATYKSDTASSIASVTLYIFSYRRSVSYSETPLLTLHYFNLLLTGASCSLVSQKCNFSASLRNHIFVCLATHHAFRQEKSSYKHFYL